MILLLWSRSIISRTKIEMALLCNVIKALYSNKVALFKSPKGGMAFQKRGKKGAKSVKRVEIGILKKPGPGSGKRVLKVDREGPGPGKPGIPVPGFIPVASKKPGKGTRKPGNGSGSRTRSDLYIKYDLILNRWYWIVLYSLFLESAEIKKVLFNFLYGRFSPGFSNVIIGP